jgi:hypothetical protein
VAPGNKIYGVDFNDMDNLESYWSGTSQSTAMVSALASLLISQKTSRTVEEVQEIIISTAQDRIGDPNEDSQGWDQFMGYGRIDCYLALTFNGEFEKTKDSDYENKNNNENYNTEDENSVNKQAKSKPQQKGEEKNNNKREEVEPAKRR